MKWRKIKHLFSASGQYEWMESHAANPFVEVLPDGKWLVYFSSRNKFNQSHISAIVLSPENNFTVECISPRPLLSPGEPGLFDDSGTSMGYILKSDNKKYLYYMGWNLRVTVPWLNTIGLAISENNGNDGYPEFYKYSPVPIMDRSIEDPYSISYPSVMVEKDTYKMWYGSNLSWGKDKRDMKHVFKYAESSDGIHWRRTNKIILNHIYPNEYALSKPLVIKENSIYKMWYSYRGRNHIKEYRIGYAESKDGINWSRLDDKVGIDVSYSGWDSEMICYPFVFDYHGARYMIYNGNGYGLTGFGLAVLDN